VDVLVDEGLLPRLVRLALRPTLLTQRPAHLDGAVRSARTDDARMLDIRMQLHHASQRHQPCRRNEQFVQPHFTRTHAGFIRLASGTCTVFSMHSSTSYTSESSIVLQQGQEYVNKNTRVYA
jgi:hypothetical protein